MAHTTTETYTVEGAMDRTNPTDWADSLRKIGLGKFVRTFVDEVTETHASGEHDGGIITLAGAPVPGSVRVSVTTAGGTITNFFEQAHGVADTADGFVSTTSAGVTTLTIKAAECPNTASVHVAFLQFGGNNAELIPLSLDDLAASMETAPLK